MLVMCGESRFIAPSRHAVQPEAVVEALSFQLAVTRHKQYAFFIQAALWGSGDYSLSTHYAYAFV